jgi:hypothetical protein
MNVDRQNRAVLAEVTVCDADLCLHVISNWPSLVEFQV